MDSNICYDIRLENQVYISEYNSYLSTQPMLIDITFIVTSIYGGISSSYRKKYLYQLKGQNNTIQVESRYTYFRHDHDLVAWQLKLLDSLSENNFGMPIRIHLIIAIQGKEIKFRDEKKGADLTHIGCIKSINSCVIPCNRILRQNQIAISRILILTLLWCVWLILPLVKPIFAIRENHRTYIQGWSEKLLIPNYQDGLHIQIYIVSICKQTVELDVPYDTFFPSAMVNGI